MGRNSKILGPDGRPISGDSRGSGLVGPDGQPLSNRVDWVPDFDTGWLPPVLAPGESSAIPRGGRHRRFIKEEIPHHVVSKIIQARMLLTPDRQGFLAKLILGVIGQAQCNWPDVVLYAFVFMSNHLHMMIQGKPDEFAKFVGFVKREISRRWGQEVGWPGAFYSGRYLATALPSEVSQLNCLSYILSHGVKEGLVDRPEHWAGANCVRALTDGEKLEGKWLDGTLYGQKKRYQRRHELHGKAKKSDRVCKKDFYSPREVILARLPAFEQLSEADYRAEMGRVVDNVVEAVTARRGGEPSLGMDRVYATDPHQRGTYTPPPWFEERKRLIAWDSPKRPEAIAYAEEYWVFQRDYQRAAEAYRAGDQDIDYPPRAFRPGIMTFRLTQPPRAGSPPTAPP